MKKLAIALLIAAALAGCASSSHHRSIGPTTPPSTPVPIHGPEIRPTGFLPGMAAAPHFYFFGDARSIGAMYQWEF